METINQRMNDLLRRAAGNRVNPPGARKTGQGGAQWGKPISVYLLRPQGLLHQLVLCCDGMHNTDDRDGNIGPRR